MAMAFTEKLRRLANITSSDLEGLEALCSQVRVHAAGESVFAEGSTSPYLHIVLDGWAARYRTLSDGRRQFPALHLSGDVCDLDRLQMDRLDFGAIALTSCRVARLPLGRLMALFDERPVIRETFWWLTCVENAIATEWAVSLGRRSALERVAHLLCELKVRVEAAQPLGSDEYSLPMTQENIGDVVGLSVVHVNRTLQALRQRGLISLRERRLTILDYDALRHLCDFRQGYLHLEDGRAEHVLSRAARSPRPDSSSFEPGHQGRAG